ncbi:MAG: hypothetical protein R2705_21595 [Ilumatobacteraceae bacterium]
MQLLKDAGITPIAVGAGDKWPAHFWYSYLMVRMCGAAEMTTMASDGDFGRDCVVKAGQMVGDLVALDPFQEGFLGAGWDAPDGGSGTMASQGAAMDLMGQWAPGAFRNQAGITDHLAAPAGSHWDGRRSPRSRAVLVTRPMRSAVATGSPSARTHPGGGGLPRLHHECAEPAHLGPEQRSAGERRGVRRVSDPNMQAVLAGLNEAPFLQLFLDQFFTAEIGATVNDQTALLFAGATSPEDAAAAITSVAQG